MSRRKIAEQITRCPRASAGSRHPRHPIAVFGFIQAARSANSARLRTLQALSVRLASPASTPPGPSSRKAGGTPLAATPAATRRAHAVFPKHRRDHLFHQRLLKRRRLGNRLTSGVGKHPEFRRSKSHRIQKRRERRARRLHQPRVVGAGHIERHHTLKSEVLRCRSPPPRPSLFQPEMMIWPGALKFAASISNCAQSSATFARSSPITAAMPPRRLLAGHLHQAAALGHHAQAGREIKHPRRRVGRHLAERKTQRHRHVTELTLLPAKSRAAPVRAQTGPAGTPSSA